MTFVNKLLAAALLSVTVAACAAPSGHTGDGSGHSYAATVTAVHDGDTLRVTDRHGRKHKIRMAYIDAPELDQAHGQASRNALRALLDRQEVEIEVFDTDQYRREVARVRLNGQDVNLGQLAGGHAWHYRSIARKNQNPADYRRYQAAEDTAKQQRNGLWQNRNAVAPWSFRREQRRQQHQPWSE